MSKYWSKTGKLIVFTPFFEIKESEEPNKKQLKKIHNIILKEFEKRKKDIVFIINKKLSISSKYPALIELTHMMIVENQGEFPRFVVRGTRVFDETVNFSTNEKHEYGKLLKEAFDSGYDNLIFKVIVNAKPQLTRIKFIVRGEAFVP